MNKRVMLYINTGITALFVISLFISFATMEAEGTHQTWVTITECVGGASILLAGISLVYLKDEHRFVPLSILYFFAPWLLYALGHEIGFDASTPYVWAWFIGLYLLLIAGFILIRMLYFKMHGVYQLIPAVLLFVNGILLVYLLFLQLWWLLPFGS